MPLGAIVIALGLRVIPVDIRRVGRRHFDVTGALLVTAGLVSLTPGVFPRRRADWPPGC